MEQTTGQTTRQAARGAFITLEGVDGAGKSTHTDWLVAQLRSAGVPVLCTREPGGTPLGERLRALLLSEPMRVETEALLMFAARSEHIAQVIEPALAAGTWVVCDRYLDASYAYQGGGRELGAERVAALAAWLGLDEDARGAVAWAQTTRNETEPLGAPSPPRHAAPQPDLTWVFDVPLELARARAARARAPDRFEREGAAFFARTRAAYQARAGQFPARIRLIDATRSIAAIRQELAAHLHALLAVHPGGRQGERA